MSDLRFEPVQSEGGDTTLSDWRQVHNLIIPTDPLSAEEVRVRAHRNHLTVTYRRDLLVGCATVRPPADNPTTATVIVRVLPQYRRQGIGEEMYRQALLTARDFGARVIETVVLASNDVGLRFAQRRGFVEIDRYILDGQTIPFIDLRLAEALPQEPAPPLARPEAVSDLR